MEDLSRAPLRPSRRENQVSGFPSSDRNVDDGDQIYEQNYSFGEDKIHERTTASLFFFTSLRGQRLAFEMKSGQTIEGVVGQQQWQFLRVNDVVVISKGGRKKVRWKMINVGRIESFHSADDDGDEAAG